MASSKHHTESESEIYRKDFTARDAIDVAIEIAPMLVRAEALCRMHGLEDLSGPLSEALETIERHLVSTSDTDSADPQTS